MSQRLPLILATTALVVAVFGSTPIGRAAKGLVIPADSVGTAQLKSDAVTAAKVKDGSLVAADFKRGQLPRGATGPQGPAGAAGAQGPAGAAGAKGDKGDPATSLWGLVGSSSLQRGSGVSGVMLTGAGTFRVSFNRDVSQCAVLATAARNGATIAASGATDKKEDVIVASFDSAGRLSGDFSIAAFC